MDRSNSKFITLSFILFSLLIGFTTSLLLKAFSGAFSIVARLSDSDLVRHGFPVLVGFALFFSLQFNSKITAWGDEVVSEIKKVVFPSRKDTTAMTVVVVVMVLISSLIITSFDFLSAYFIKSILN